MNDLAADAAARARAVDPHRSVILQAPAGSGKTTVLINRLLALLAQADAPEEVLAITFTRKAAAEMALRVAQALKAPDAVAQAVRARSAARGWRLVENPGRLRIQTLDSLNRSLALQMPLAARGVGALGVLPQPLRAYRTAARRALLDAQTDAALRPDAQRLFERMENDFARCEHLLADMLAKRPHWLPYVVGDAAGELAARVRESLVAVVEARLARVREGLPAELLAAGLALCRDTAPHLQARGVAPGTWWQGLAALALTKQGEWRQQLTVRHGFPPQERALKQRGTEWLAGLAGHRGAHELFQELALLPDPELSADETDMLESLARLLQLAVAELNVVFAEWGRVDYPAIAAAARDALGSVDEPTDLALRFDSRVRHILVDEFQDTSIEQTHLLALLTAGWSPDDGRTLFLVGDPMQSIYGFREAEVGMFLNARTAGVGAVRLEALQLRRNFRSAPQIVEWINAVFARCFPQADDPRTSSVAYAYSLPAQSGSAAGSVHLHRVLPRDPAGEARAIARVVGALRAAQSDSSIAVLLSSRVHAGPIVAALEARGIAVAGVELVSLAKLSIVRDLTALTQALDHEADRTAWCAILRAPWCGLTLVQITALIGPDRHATVWERLCDEAVVGVLDPAAQARVRRLRDALAAGRHPDAARCVERTWLALGGPAACAHETDLRHARAFFDALAGWAQEPDWSGPQDLPERLERLYASHDTGTAGAVQVMTIHRAKGLEFDHVILPGLGRSRRRSDRELLQWLDLPRDTQGSDLLMVAVPPAAATAATPLGTYVSRLQRQRAQQEATRLLYVAATRAKLQLHLFAQLADPVAGMPPPVPTAGTLLERLWSALRDRFPDRAEADLTIAVPAVDDRAPTALERLSVDWCLPQLPPPPRVRGVPIASYEPPQTPSGHAVDAVDQVVCEVLRALARQRRGMDDDSELLLRVTTRLQRLMGPIAELDVLASRGLMRLQSCRTDPRLQWILSNIRSPQSQAEVPLALTGIFEGRLTSIEADVSFVDTDGLRWLIDIAPMPAEGQEAVEAAFALRLARNEQLATALDQSTARAAVYLPAARVFWTGPQRTL